MATNIEGNHKRVNIPYIVSIPSTGTQNICMYCFVCKQLWDATAAAGSIKGHMLAEHGFTDVG